MSQPSAAPRGPEHLPVIDVDHLQGFTDGDLSLERELAELYLSSADLYLARLKAALDEPETWRRHAHALKGASSNLGALEVAGLARAAEHGTRGSEVLEELRAAVERVRTFFRQRGS